MKCKDCAFSSSEKYKTVMIYVCNREKDVLIEPIGEYEYSVATHCEHYFDRLTGENPSDFELPD